MFYRQTTELATEVVLGMGLGRSESGTWSGSRTIDCSEGTTMDRSENWTG